MEDEKVDRLSGLPGNVIDQILSSMPTKEAAKTSLLSSQWRNTWKYIPSLSITCEWDTEPDQFIKRRFVAIRNFRIYLYRTTPSADKIENWIDPLSRHPIEHFVINSHWSMIELMPSSSFFSWKTLTHLRLTNSHISSTPSTFRGFERLKSLDLESVTIGQESLQSLISGSPALETLTLSYNKLDDRLVIDTPSLKSFRFCCLGFVELRLINCNVLETFHFHVSHLNCAAGLIRGDNLMPLMDDAPRLRFLRISIGASLEYLASGIVPRELPTPLADLRVMWIGACFNCTKHASGFYMLLSSLPNLQELHVDFGSFGNQDWEAAQWDLAFPRLGRFCVRSYRDSLGETDFIKRILSASPNLVEISIKLFSDPRKSELIKKQLFGLECASPTAKMSVR